MILLCIKTQAFYRINIAYNQKIEFWSIPKFRVLIHHSVQYFPLTLLPEAYILLVFDIASSNIRNFYLGAYFGCD